MVITDRFDHIIDDKNRLAIPSEFRNAMDPQIDGTSFYIVPEGRYLQLIPEKLFQKLAGLANAGLSVPTDAARARRLVFANTPRVEPDKQGRVIIPDRFLAESKNCDPFSVSLAREVTLVGVGDRAEIWNRAELMNHMHELFADRNAIQENAKNMFQTVGPATGPLPSAT